mmetsp:Transcript_13909/g.27032  ORF Transcript_13909/g.27032 Transcript_13909/m.27032 type:complete len:115 (+) Transcript_13909:1389-1733(+)
MTERRRRIFARNSMRSSLSMDSKAAASGEDMEALDGDCGPVDVLRLRPSMYVGLSRSIDDRDGCGLRFVGIYDVNGLVTPGVVVVVAGDRGEKEEEEDEDAGAQPLEEFMWSSS